MVQPLSTVPVGSRFHVAAIPHLRRELVRLGSGSAVVRPLTPVTKQFTAHSADPDRARPVAFTSSHKVEVMSLGTMVEIEEDDNGTR
jgi:hypothetical protein